MTGVQEVAAWTIVALLIAGSARSAWKGWAVSRLTVAPHLAAATLIIQEFLRRDAALEEGTSLGSMSLTDPSSGIEIIVRRVQTERHGEALH